MTPIAPNTATSSGRAKAFFVHLLLSACVGAVVGAVFWFVLYPPPLFRAVGGLEIFLTVLAVDIVLGPCLTLLAYRKGKKNLVFDLSVIAAVQIAALTYGVITLYAGRPVFVAALGHRFDVIQASEVSPEDIKLSNRSLPAWGPAWVGIRRPDDPTERSDMFLSAVAGADLGHKPQYHADLSTMQSESLKEAKPLSDLKALNPGRETELDHWLTSHSRKETDVRFLGLKARAQDMAVLIDGKSGEVVGVVPFKPWP